MEEGELLILVQKYANGTASPEEREKLFAWYQSQVETTSLLPYLNPTEEAVARENMLLNLQRQINDEPFIKRKPKFIFYKVAAAAVLILGCFLTIFFSKYAGKKDAIAFYTITTKAGERKVVTLTDGSTIWLSAKSRLIYPATFKDSTREVNFEGEAFFDIAKDKHHPFIVHSGTTSTRVLGTTFNIKFLRSKPSIVVSLVTGKVAFSDGKVSARLTPGYQIIYNQRKQKMQLSEIPDVAMLINRKNGDYEYKDERVEDVIDDVNLNFNTNIKVEGKVRDCPFFGRIKPGEDLSKFLKMLAIVNKAELIEKNGGYIIKGGGCDNDLK